jgi:hypothetical protein
MSRVDAVFIGSEAIARGDLTRHQLIRWYQPIFSGVYVPKQRELTIRDRTIAAYLWSRRKGVIAGAAASALHGARWVDADTPIEIIWNASRAPTGLVCRNERLTPAEITRVAGIPVTTLSRTAFDLGRHLPREDAIARLDALTRATPFAKEKVLQLAGEHRGARGVKALKQVLPLVDGGGASPKETWLRLLLIDAGLPTPTTQIPLHLTMTKLAVLDMGWRDFLVAAEYDGKEHQSERDRYVKDRWRRQRLKELGWLVVTVIREDRPEQVIERVRGALMARGWRP